VLRGGEEEPPEAEGSEDAGRPLRLNRHVGSQLIGAALGVLVLVMVVAQFPQTYPPPDPGGANGAPEEIEYEAAAVQTLAIAAEAPAKSYTIVGTSEDYDRILTRGFHVQLWVFARDIRLEDARNPGYTIPIPTRDVYIFVEKETYHPPVLPPIGPTEEYYRDFGKRDRIMEIVHEWAEAYRISHGNMDVYYEDAEIVIYHVRHNPVIAETERSAQFKDYTWEPGALFNE
ncbi:MAG: hypothetical protein HY658_04885, partial [Actinobacteria bacterium]|nr:hypothetical protein [Actinomycetota bacterium]